MDSMQLLRAELLNRAMQPAAVHDRVHAAVQQSARWWCGQWLARRRIQNGYTLDDMAQRAHLDVRQVLLLELGIIDADALPDEMWYRVCLMLEHAGDIEWVATVLFNALGYADDAQERVVAAVAADLDLGQLYDEQAFELLAQAGEQHLRPEVLRVLCALRHAALTALTAREVKQQLADVQPAQPAIGLMSVHQTLQVLMRCGIVEQQANAAGDTADEEFYVLTPSGEDFVRTSIQRAAVARQQRTLTTKGQQLQQHMDDLVKPLMQGLAPS